MDKSTNEEVVTKNEKQNKSQRKNVNPSKVINIIRYRNRKLYDTDRSLYTSAKEIAQMLTEDSEMTLVAKCEKTQEDITKDILHGCLKYKLPSEELKTEDLLSLLR